LAQITIALLLIEWDLPEGNAPSRGKSADLVMMVLTGGKERTVEEYRRLLRGAGFALNKVTPTGAEHNYGLASKPRDMDITPGD